MPWKGGTVGDLGKFSLGWREASVAMARESNLAQEKCPKGQLFSQGTGGFRRWWIPLKFCGLGPLFPTQMPVLDKT